MNAFWVAAAVVVVLTASEAFAAFRMCAFREGPRGPCTCKSETDAAGQFTVVSRAKCASANPAENQKKESGGSVATPSETPPSAQTAPSAEPVPPTGTAAPLSLGPAEPANRTTSPKAASGGSPRTLDAVKARGKLTCGVNTRLLGFSAQTDSGTWFGIDVEFCRAVAAAVLGDASKVDFVPLETNQRFDALTAGKIDVLSRNTTWTMNREIDLGFSFAGVLYFDGQGFMIGDERGLVSAQQLSGTKVCVESGTTSEKNVAFYFKAQQIDAVVQTFPTREETLNAYLAGTCDAYSGDRSALFSDRASFAEPTKHTILPEVISKEPLGPLVLRGDDEWADIVRWTLAGLINAEEVGLDKASAAASQPLSDDAQRLIDGAAASGEKLRLRKTWLRDAVAAAGNYGEMFEANLGKTSALGMNRGINALWKRGGILYAPPMW